MTMRCGEDTPEVIKSLLDKRRPRRIEDRENAYRHAGVLIPLLIDEGVCKVLFIRRTMHVPHHKGQISFPGGRTEKEDDSIMETVLREVDEEIGVAREDIAILGWVDDAVTLSSSFLVHALVGHVPHPYDYRIDSGEVEEIITVPLAAFHPGETRHRRRVVEHEGIVYRSTAYEFEGMTIWGATARIMENFMEIVAHRLPFDRP